MQLDLVRGELSAKTRGETSSTSGVERINLASTRITSGPNRTIHVRAAASVAVVWRRPGLRHVTLPALVNEAEISAEQESYSELSEGMRAALAHSLAA